MSKTPKDNEEVFDPLGDVRQFFSNHHKSGDLGIIALTGVVLYNLLFFDFPQGYGIYSFFQMFCLVIAFTTQYWKRPDMDKIGLVGVLFLSFGLAFDFIVSLSYIPNWEQGTLQYGSIPTAVIDIVGLVSTVLWFKSLEVKNSQESN